MLRKILTYFLLTTSTFIYADQSPKKNADLDLKQDELIKQPGTCTFIPPKGWEMIDSKVLLPEVKAMVKGKSIKPTSLPPSINLAMEVTDLTAEQYLAAIKEMNSLERNRDWARIGTIKTKAGEMYLTQLDTTSQWGQARMVQAVMVKDKNAYVITATAQLDEFAQFSSEFLKSIQSFEINKEK